MAWRKSPAVPTTHEEMGYCGLAGYQKNDWWGFGKILEMKEVSWMAGHDRGGNGIIFKVTEDGAVSIDGYVLSTSYEMQTRIQPMIQKVAPVVRQFFEDALKAEMAKETRFI
jgi:hypothetical protein